MRTIRLKLRVGATDTCATVLTRYGITQQNFINWNSPNIGSGCSGFVAGEMYCVRGSESTLYVKEALAKFESRDT
jgi:hypothetical protein